ncbi:MAG: deoxyribonuclease V [Candidatus Nitrosomirales archaeon]|jgi:deoxyribonuclease V
MYKLMGLTVEEAIKLQQNMAKDVVKHDVIEQQKIKHICGVDISYRGNKAFSCAVVIERKSLAVIESAYHESTVESPYIPGLLFLRESEPILAVLDKLHDYDLLMVDGHGMLHPRKFGIACYIGVKIDRPTIGVGKSLLCGTVVQKNNSQMVQLDGKKLGIVVKTNSKPIYVSIGHKVSLKTASKIVKEVTKYRIPEPLRLADINARKMART